MKNVLFFFALLCLAGCSKILGENGAKITYTGTLYKDCDRTPFANAKIVYTTFRGTGVSPLTRSFDAYTDANGKFTITEGANGLHSIYIELAAPPNFKDGPKIVQYDYNSQTQEDVTVNLGELFATSRGEAGTSKYLTNINLKISPYYRQKDSLIIGYYRDAPLVLSPVPATFTGKIWGANGFESFAPLTSNTEGSLVWATSLQAYRNPVVPPSISPNAYKGKTVFTLCGTGPETDFVVDTFSHP